MTFRIQIRIDILFYVNAIWRAIYQFNNIIIFCILFCFSFICLRIVHPNQIDCLKSIHWFTAINANADRIRNVMRRSSSLKKWHSVNDSWIQCISGTYGWHKNVKLTHAMKSNGFFNFVSFFFLLSFSTPPVTTPSDFDYFIFRCPYAMQCFHFFRLEFSHAVCFEFHNFGRRQIHIFSCLSDVLVDGHIQTQLSKWLYLF